MEITLENIGRRFNRDWIFRGINYSFLQGQSYAILGRNGSGKSTLLQIVAGSLSSSEGMVIITQAGKSLADEELFRYLSIAAPYLELIEEFTLSEMIDFHFKFKPYMSGINKASFVELLELPGSKNKEIKYFSSGMKQRTKLALAICSDTPLLLLDEPTSNLDSQAITWYQDLIARFAAERTVIVCSNQEHEYEFCLHHLSLSDYKQI